MYSKFKKDSIILNSKLTIEINKFLYSDDSHIFNTFNFFYLNANKTDLYFQLVDNNKKKVIANVNFHLNKKNEFESPIKGTFGGFFFSSNLKIEILEKFMKNIFDYLHIYKPNSIIIKLPPFIHSITNNTIVTNILNRLNFKILSLDLNYHMNVDNEDFMHKVNYSNKKRIKKCQNSSFFAKKLDFDHFDDVYDLIASNRIRKKYVLSMQKKSLIEMMKLFPEEVLLFGVFNESLLVASSICIKINNDILYVFYWADGPNMQQYSPVTLLAKNIYDFCQANSYKILDIGTSSINSLPNYGLIDFKKSLGFNESLKITMKYN